MPVYMAIPFLGVFVAFGAFAAALAARTRAVAPLILGVVFFAVGLVIGLAIYPALSLVTLVPLGAFMGMVGYRSGAAPRWVQMMRGSAESVDDSTAWISARGDGSSDGTGSSDGGGSSGGGDFGGGDSGGGGASGSW